MTGIRSVLLDRDGVLNTNRDGGVTAVSEWEWLPRALDGCRALAGFGYQLAIVTNQSVIGRRRLSEAGLREIHEHMLAGLAAHGVPEPLLFWCPHLPDDGCPCRKPQPGLLRAAMTGTNTSPERAVMIGDHVTDMMAAQAASCWSIHVQTGRGATPALPPERFLGSVADLPAAAELVRCADLALTGAGRRNPPEGEQGC